MVTHPENPSRKPFQGNNQNQLGRPQNPFGPSNQNPFQNPLLDQGQAGKPFNPTGANNQNPSRKPFHGNNQNLLGRPQKPFQERPQNSFGPIHQNPLQKPFQGPTMVTHPENPSRKPFQGNNQNILGRPQKPFQERPQSSFGQGNQNPFQRPIHGQSPTGKPFNPISPGQFLPFDQNQHQFQTDFQGNNHVLWGALNQRPFNPNRQLQDPYAPGSGVTKYSNIDNNDDINDQFIGYQFRNEKSSQYFNFNVGDWKYNGNSRSRTPLNPNIDTQREINSNNIVSRRGPVSVVLS